MKHPASLELYSYWNRLRRGRAAPERSDIDPAAIRTVLADTLMIEVEQNRSDRSGLPIRLSGTRVNALFGADLRGRSLVSLWRLQDRRNIASLVSAVLDDTRPMVAGCRAAPAGEPGTMAELLLLPLRHRGRTHARLLGALSLNGVPSWLGLTPAAPMTLATYRMIDTEAAAAGPAVVPHLQQSGGTRYGQFVIYEGGRA